MEVYARPCFAWVFGKGSILAGVYDCGDLFLTSSFRFLVQKSTTVQEVLSKRVICDPLTIAMSAPTGDGGAAAILCSEQFMREQNLQVGRREGWVKWWERREGGGTGG